MLQVINSCCESFQYAKHAVKNEATSADSIRGYINYLNETTRQIQTFFLKFLRKTHVGDFQIFIRLKLFFHILLSYKRIIYHSLHKFEILKKDKKKVRPK